MDQGSDTTEGADYDVPPAHDPNQGELFDSFSETMRRHDYPEGS